MSCWLTTSTPGMLPPNGRWTHWSADALRALTDSFADISGELAASAVATDRSRRAKAAQFTGLSRRGREPGA